MEETWELAVVSLISELNSLDSVVKIVQLFVQTIFYLTVGLVAVLTYRSAKKTLLNSMNTEYHKKEFQSLELLSKELYSEFDPESDIYWPRDNEIVEFAKEFKSSLEKYPNFETDGLTEVPFEEKHLLEVRATPVLSVCERLSRQANKYQSEPFLPDVIRDPVVTYLKDRSMAMQDAWTEEFRWFREELIAGNKVASNPDWDEAVMSNRINDRLKLTGFNIGDAEKRVHELRALIQSYLRKFDPLKAAK